MKKTIITLLSIVLCFSLCACGKSDGNNSGSVAESELLGEWYEVKSADRFVLNSDGSSEYYKNNSYPQPGSWKVNGDVIDINSSYVDDLKIEFERKTISLNNDESTFMRWENLPKDKLSIGDSGQKENIKITLTDVNFTKEAPDCLADSVWNSELEMFTLEEGMTYAKVSLNILNMSKQEINIPDINLKLDVVVNYNDGFVFSTHDNNNSFFATNTDYVISEGIGGLRGSDIPIQPLQEKSFDIYIPCSELVANDEKSPLTIGIISHYDTEIYYCEYSVR